MWHFRERPRLEIQLVALVGQRFVMRADIDHTPNRWSAGVDSGAFRRWAARAPSPLQHHLSKAATVAHVTEATTNEGFRILLERDAKPLEVEEVLRSTEEGDYGVDGIIIGSP